MITTTLNRIREHKPCEPSWRKLLMGLGKTAADDEPLPYARIVEICGLNDALWACRAEPQHAMAWRRYAVWCARQVQHLMTDSRSIAAIDVADRHTRGEADNHELIAAWGAAWDAVWDVLWGVERPAAWVAVRVAVCDEAISASWTADWADWAARASGSVSNTAIQTDEFIRLVNQEPPQ